MLRSKNFHFVENHLHDPNAFRCQSHHTLKSYVHHSLFTSLLLSYFSYCSHYHPFWTYESFFLSFSIFTSSPTIIYLSIIFLCFNLRWLFFFIFGYFFIYVQLYFIFLYSIFIQCMVSLPNYQAYNLYNTNLLESSFRLNGQFSSHLVLIIMLILKDPILKIF